MAAKDPPTPTLKSHLDAVLLKIPGVVGKKMAGLDAYFMSDRMFACITDNGLGLRVPVSTAQELQFSRADVSEFKPAGVPTTREWVQIHHDDPTDYEKDMDLFVESIKFVRGGR
jgi:hypothetical protein